MAFLDFLRHKTTPASPDAQAAEIEAAHARLAEDRALAQAVLDGLEARRQTLLVADAPEAQILALAAEADAARIRLEKCDAFEIELEARQSELAGLEAERARREAFDVYHAAACEYASSINSAIERLFTLRRAMGAVAADDIGQRLGLEAPPILLTAERLQSFLRDIERAADFEQSRRAAIDRRAAAAVTAAEV
jgi:hypothetical protein